MKNSTKYSTSPPSVQTLLEKKSQAHKVLACILRNSSQEPSPRFGPGSKPFSLRIFRTVPLLIDRPSFFSSPMMRPRPQAFSRAICTTSWRTSSGFRGRPPLDCGFRLPTDLVCPFTHRAKVRGVTIVINSLIFEGKPANRPSAAMSWFSVNWKVGRFELAS